MLKLFLSSMAISPEQGNYFIDLVGKNPEDIQFALIENAADGEDGDKSWMLENRQAIKNQGFAVDIVDLNLYRSDKAGLAARLADKDAIWLGGGNTYYLRWLLHDTGADQLITQLVHNGTVYGGGSAGAVVAGPTLKHFDKADDPQVAPQVYWNGLGLTNTTVVPHIDNEQFAEILTEANNKLIAEGYATVTLTDAQALIINGDQQKVI